MDFQIRIRTDASFSECVYLQEWLDAARAGFAFNHNKPGNNHYHIYLFGLDRKPDSLRKTLGKYLPTKECYSVGTTAGKKREPIDPRIAYQYGTEKTLTPPVWTKGYDEQVLERYRFSSEAFYRQQERVHTARNEVVTEVMVVTEEKVKTDRVWERLIEDVIRNPEKYENKAVHRIKSMIAVSYLNNLKAIPRNADLHRYATSIYHIVRHGMHRQEHKIPDDALDREYLMQ